MILLIDLSWEPDSLSHDEFVGPVARIVSRAGDEWREAHFTGISGEMLRDIWGVILCGTAVQDNFFAEDMAIFDWLRDIKIPVLGICAGMEVLCALHGGSLRPACEIGMSTIRIKQPDPLLPDKDSFEAYELHSFTCDPPANWIVTAVSDTCVQAIRHPDRAIFGVMFHPEVRNDHVVERFCRLCQDHCP